MIIDIHGKPALVEQTKEIINGEPAFVVTTAITGLTGDKKEDLQKVIADAFTDFCDEDSQNVDFTEGYLNGANLAYQLIYEEDYVETLIEQAKTEEEELDFEKFIEERMDEVFKEATEKFPSIKFSISVDEA